MQLKPPTRPKRAQPTTIFILAILVLMTTACFQTQPTARPTEQPSANLGEREIERREVETAVKATVEARTAQMQAEPDAQTQVIELSEPPTSRPPPAPISVHDCDQLLRNQLELQAEIVNSRGMNEIIRNIQTAMQGCEAEAWNPVATNPRPDEEDRCLPSKGEINKTQIPETLLAPTKENLQRSSIRDEENNILVHWSNKEDERPADESSCWIYLAYARVWWTENLIPMRYTIRNRPDLVEGDCIILSGTIGETEAEISQVPCDGEWTHRVLGMFDVERLGEYPGEGYFGQQAYEKCGPKFSMTTHPNEESWQAADRTVICMEKSFSLSTSDPEKLERLTRITALETGDCFNTAPETGGRMVELVECGDTWESRAISQFQSSFTLYPSEDERRKRAIEHCDRRYTSTRFPLPETWTWGNRTFHCIQDNISGGTPDLDRLDRSVITLLLQPGECFSLDDDTGGYLSIVADCTTGDGDFLVTGKTRIPKDGEYPGEEELIQRAEVICGTNPQHRLFPDEFLWELGHRNILCVNSIAEETFSEHIETDPVEEARKRLERGIELVESGQPNEGLRELEQAQELYGGTSDEVETWMGFAHEEMSNYPAAIRHYSNAIRINDSALNRIIRAYAYMANENFEAAATDAQSALEKPTENSNGFNTEVEANWILAIHQERLGNYQAALQHATSARTNEAANEYPPAELKELDDLIQDLIAETTPREPIPPTRTPIGESKGQPLTALTDLQNAKWLRNTSPETAQKLASLPWAADGLSEKEEAIIEQLLHLYVNNNTQTAISLIDMPFLQSIEAGDLQAVDSLEQVSRNNRPAFEEIMNHPTFSTYGITDPWTPVIATLGSVQKNNRSLITVLLDHEKIHLETREIRTPLKGAVILNIVRTNATYEPQSMDFLENAVRSAEEFMKEPLPTDAVTVLYADAVRGDNSGENSVNAIVIIPKHDLPDAEYAQEINDHEVAHYYWGGNENWVDEGMADFMTSLFKAQQAGTRIIPRNPPCPVFRAISQMPASDETNRCDYSLGERLFIDLYDTAGAAEFQQKMATLYRESTVEDNLDNMTGTKIGISQLKAQFISTASKEVIDRWHHGTAQYRTDLYDRDPVNPNLSVMDALITRAELSINNAPVNTFSASRINANVELSIDYEHTVPVGTSGDIPFHFVLFYQDGHPFWIQENVVRATEGSIGFSGIGVYVWSPGHPKPATGEYVGYIYEGGNKVAQVHWTVTP